MKKLLLGALALATLAASSCKKDDDDNKPAQSWTVAGTTYTPLQVVSTGSGLSASTTAGGGQAIIFQFSGNALPTASGSYNVTQTIDNNSVNQVAIVASDIASQGGYIVQSGTVAVTVSGGKVTVDLPSSPEVYAGMTTKANAQVSAHLTQN